MIRYTKDTDHIAILTLDMKGRQRNLLNHEIVAAFVPVIQHLKKQKSKGELRGVIITSAKKNFLVGGNLKYLSDTENPKDIFDYAEKLKSFFRELEQPGIPVVAAINGNAIGTGFELALACHYRIVLNKQDIRIGLPEAKYGVMPGNGGTIRLLWLMGIEQAFHLLAEGKEWTPAEAKMVGLVDELATDQADMILRAKRWLLKTKEVVRPWDQPNAMLPDINSMPQKIAKLSAHVAARWKQHYPAQQAILNTLNEGSQVDFATACRIESRYYTALLLSPESRNITQALWFDQNQISNGISRPKGFGKLRPKKIGIVGAGVMGSGIAASCLAAGYEVLLKDVSRMIAEQGKERVAQMLEAYLKSGKILKTTQEECIAKIHTTESAEGFIDCDLVIESVFENVNLKRKVVSETEQYIDEFAFFASNTVSIPITQLAEKSIRPEQFVGLHFLRHADSMPLVEIVRGEQTNDETIAKAFDFVKSIGKTPIVVKDDWGFYVARVQNTYILEGITMLQEGYLPALIENLGLQSGMPKGPLALADELSFDLVLRYEQQAADHYGSKYIQHPAVTVLKKMMDELKRNGHKKNGGFYEQNDENKKLWPGLNDHFTFNKSTYDQEEIMERFLFVQILEAVWCLHEGVIKTEQEANLGSVLGWGFPSFKGGVIQYIKNYGKSNFIKRCNELKSAHGQRFSVPGWLKNNLA
ncbi:MAG: 3-hydroxyacyl-CoA dehydrogenase NAD-binding domain-containing protein [Saprospiraceae bacterium]